MAELPETKIFVKIKVNRWRVIMMAVFQVFSDLFQTTYLQSVKNSKPPQLFIKKKSK